MKPRKKYIERRTQPKRSTKRIKVRRGDPAKRRWAKLRDAAFQEWVRDLPCMLAGNPRGFECLGTTECCHVKSRSTGGADLDNCVPMCSRHHRCQHLWGIKTFASFFDVDLQRLALKYGAQYRKAA